MDSLKEIFSFSRAETIALSILLTVCLVGGGILIYEHSRQSLPPQLIFESLEATPLSQQAPASDAQPASARTENVSAQSPEQQFQRTRNLVLNINTAPAESLALLPFIGETLSRRIVDYRANHGAFSSVDQLISVYGIGPKNIVKMRPYLICN
ncbi:MAG: helix-hairpin-helix domain-containing protein [Candidatus Zixiibacteriota bacterium]